MTMAPSEDITGFLKLPPELRDRIYDFCFQEKQQKHDRSGFRRAGTTCFDIRASLPQLRLANRQVKSEYNKRSPLNSILEAPVTNYNFYTERYEQLSLLPRLAAMSTVVSVSLEFHNHIDAYYYCDDLQLDLRMLTSINPALTELVEALPHLKRLNVSMYFLNQTCSWVQEVMSFSQKVYTVLDAGMINYPQLAKLAELSLIWSKLDGIENVRPATWTPEGGFECDEETFGMRLRSCPTYTHCTRDGHMNFRVEVVDGHDNYYEIDA
jgi:hypothetical protein